MDPSVLGILVDDQTPHLSRERPQVIQAISRSRGDRVIPGREQHRIAIAHHVRDRFAAGTAGRIQHLHAEPVRRIDAEVVDLLKPRLAVAAVVFVRGVAAPVSRGAEGFADHEPPRVRIVHEEIVHLAPKALAAPGLDPDRGRPEEDGPTAAQCRRRDQDRFEPRPGCHGRGDAGGDVQGGGTLAEHVAATYPPALAARFNTPGTLEQHQYRLFFGAVVAGALPGREPQPPGRELARAARTPLLQELQPGSLWDPVQGVLEHGYAAPSRSTG